MESVSLMSVNQHTGCCCWKVMIIGVNDVMFTSRPHAHTWAWDTDEGGVHTETDGLSLDYVNSFVCVLWFNGSHFSMGNDIVLWKKKLLHKWGFLQRNLLWCVTVGCVQPFRLFHSLFAFCIAVTSDFILLQCKSYMYHRSFDISWSPRWHIQNACFTRPDIHFTNIWKHQILTNYSWYFSLKKMSKIVNWFQSSCQWTFCQLSNPLNDYLTQLWFTSFHLEFSTDAKWKQFKTDLFISVNTILWFKKKMKLLFGLGCSEQ